MLSVMSVMLCYYNVCYNIHSMICDLYESLHGALPAPRHRFFDAEELAPSRGSGGWGRLVGLGIG